MATTTQSTTVVCGVCGAKCRVSAAVLEDFSRRIKCPKCQTVLNQSERAPGHKTTVPEFVGVTGHDTAVDLPAARSRRTERSVDISPVRAPAITRQRVAAASAAVATPQAVAPISYWRRHVRLMAVLAAVVMVLGGAVAYMFTAPTGAHAVKRTKPKLEPVVPVHVEVAIADLAGDFKNRLAGQAKYQGKLVRVTGLANWNQRVYYSGFNLIDPDEKDARVTCYFDYQENLVGHVTSPLTNVPRVNNATMTVQGTCDATGALHNCRLITSSAEIQAQADRDRSEKVAANRLAAEKLEREIRESGQVAAPGRMVSVDTVVEIVGTVQEVHQVDHTKVGPMVELVIFLPDSRTPLYCDFRTDYAPQLSKLAIGSKVTVRGKKYAGYPLKQMGEARFMYCVLM